MVRLSGHVIRKPLVCNSWAMTLLTEKDINIPNRKNDIFFMMFEKYVRDFI
jgi:hypothetical protein